MNTVSLSALRIFIRLCEGYLIPFPALLTHVGERQETQAGKQREKSNKTSLLDMFSFPQKYFRTQEEIIHTENGWRNYLDFAK